MHIHDAIKLAYQRIKDLEERLQRVEHAQGKYATDGAIPPEPTAGSEEIEEGEEEINWDTTVFVDNSGNSSKLKSGLSNKNSVTWDSSAGCWKLYAVYKE